MTDRKQFEAMLEALINDDQETAKEIFHNIVVAKSRDIYEELLAEDFDLNEKAEEEEEEESTEEGYEEEEESVEEAEEEEGEEEEEEGSDDEVGGDATDDFIDDTEDSEDEEGEEEIEDRVMDLEDALEELKAEFEQLMAGEEGEGHHDDMGDMGDEFGGADLEVDEEDFGAPVMEYTNKVTPPKHGDNGANAKSIVAGKNDMGGTTANIAKGGVAKGEGTKGGLLDPSTKDLNSGNVNVPGAKSATKLKSVSKGHGAEKKGAGEQADNKKSTIGSR